jgi:hypothetical protein
MCLHPMQEADENPIKSIMSTVLCTCSISAIFDFVDLCAFTLFSVSMQFPFSRLHVTAILYEAHYLTRPPHQTMKRSKTAPPAQQNNQLGKVSIFL